MCLCAKKSLKKRLHKNVLIDNNKPDSLGTT